MIKSSNIEMHSTHDEEKSVFALRFIRKNFTNIWLHYQKLCIMINELIKLRNATIHAIVQSK